MFKIIHSNTDNRRYVESHIIITTDHYITRITTLDDTWRARYRVRIKRIGDFGYTWGYSDESRLIAFRNARNNLNMKIFESI